MPPSRVVADRIKLGDLFSKLEQRYLELEGFEERTSVYAQPYVFDEKSRVGLIYHEEMDLRFFPFYFQWSGGRPYRFQSLTVVGNAPHLWLPLTKPTLSIRSDVKSHFFNITFVGNVPALPAGSDAFILDQLDEEEVDSSMAKLAVDASYNYVIMMGADYWRLSAAAGPAYLATKFSLFGEDRSVLAEEPSAAFRLRYQSPGLNLRALYFYTHQTGVHEGDGSGLPSSDYKLRSQTFRAGITVAAFLGIELAADQLVTVGKYDETVMDVGDITLSYLYAESECHGFSGIRAAT